MKYFAGLDVSLQETTICIVDEDWIVVSEGKAASEPDDLVRWLAATGLIAGHPPGRDDMPAEQRLAAEGLALGGPGTLGEASKVKGRWAIPGGPFAAPERAGRAGGRRSQTGAIAPAAPIA